MIEDNRIKLSLRLKELFIDWLFICCYLGVLFLLSAIFYYLVYKGIPSFSEAESQLIATVTSVIPVVLIFSYLDFKGGSLGKRTSKLFVYFKQKKFRYSLIRNIIKFLPWQLGHIGTIRGIYMGFDNTSLVMQTTAYVLLITLLMMGVFRKDKRHLGDMLAGTQVQIVHDEF
ncbi:RDD family protein [Granulicatella seriolae]|uniref:RDD family protein n=1 Tax=Granulicatella seriolae TaxID=2967226 RepID=A0ABT1WPC1_9LACT|nr:RDD family protein [Granulicatella seriolae]